MRMSRSGMSRPSVYRRSSPSTERRRGAIYSRSSPWLVQCQRQVAANRRQNRYNAAVPGSQRFETVGFGEFKQGPCPRGRGLVFLFSVGRASAVNREVLGSSPSDAVLKHPFVNRRFGIRRRIFRIDRIDRLDFADRQPLADSPEWRTRISLRKRIR